MKMNWTLLLIAALAGAASGVAPAEAADQPLVVTGLSGSLHIDQPLPLGCDDVDRTVPVIGGRLDILPGSSAIQVGSFRIFLLTRGTIAFAPFRIHRDCDGHEKTLDYTELEVEVSRALTMFGTAAGPNRFTVAIPKDAVLLYETAIVNGEPEKVYKHPKEDVTGTIDLQQGTVTMIVKVASKVHVDVLGDYDGTLTASIEGPIAFPDTDRDGVADRSDNCRLVPNPDQSPVSSPQLRRPRR